MKRYLFFTLFLCFLFLMNWLVKAQENKERTNVAPEKFESVEEVLSTFYKTISGEKDTKRDWDKFRSLFVSGARIIPSGKADEEGHFKVFPVTLDDFIVSSKQWFTENNFYHSEIFRKTDIFSHMAHVQSTFESKTDLQESPFSRGVYSMQLFHDEERWWIVNMYWASETEENPIPTELLPASN